MDHTRLELALSLESVAFFPILSAWVLKRERYMFLRQDVSKIFWIFKSMKRERLRSQAPDSRDTAERCQNDFLKKFEQTQRP